VVLALVVVGIALVALAVPATLRVHARLADGRHGMQQARDAVVSGKAGLALGRFRAAKVSFDEAAAESSGGILGIVDSLPVIGGNVDVVRGLARAGGKTAQAGIDVATAVDALPGGVEAFAPAHGRIPLQRFPPLARAVDAAHRLVQQAVDEVRSTGGSVLIPTIADARWQAETSLADLDATLGSAAGVLGGLPAFLGADGPRTYLFGADNPAELRGTGGLIGAYALLRIEDGRLSFSSFRPVQSLPLLRPSEVPAPNPDYRRLYNPQRTGNGFWLNSNMTPDFPSAAQAFETSFEQVTGQHVDGVVTADPFALRALLEATGPAEVPSLGVTVTENDVVPFLANQAYARITNPAERKLVLGAVAETVVQRFLEAAHGTLAVRSVAKAAGDAHVLVYVNDPTMQSALAGTGAGGAFRVPSGSPADLLSVVINNGSGNKVDYYVDRDVRYSVTLEPGGGTKATTDVLLTNHAPSGGLPSYVLGPVKGYATEPGQDVSILNVYCGGTCSLTAATRQGSTFDAGKDHELGSNFFQDYFTTDPGASRTTTFSYTTSGTWTGDAGGGTYTLRFLNQPTIRPTKLSVTVRLPAGMHVVDSSDGVRADGSTATWTGTPGRTLTLRLAFAPPAPQRLWRELVS
jgi:Protein of unknown function (DUF4012)